MLWSDYFCLLSSNGASVQLLKFAIDDNIIQNNEKRYTIMNRLGYLCFCISLLDNFNFVRFWILLDELHSSVCWRCFFMWFIWSLTKIIYQGEEVC